MNPLYAAATEVQDFCRERGWAFCLVGGICVMRWGQRSTMDVDMVIVTPFGEDAALIDGLYDRFDPRYDEPHEDPRANSRLNRVVQLNASNGVGIDIALGQSRRLHRVMARASIWDIEGAQLFTCSAEDLVINKALAGRAKDWADIEGVITAQGEDLNVELILREFEPVLRQGHHLTDPLAQLQRDDHDEAVERLEKLLGVRQTGDARHSA